MKNISLTLYRFSELRPDIQHRIMMEKRLSNNRKQHWIELALRDKGWQLARLATTKMVPQSMSSLSHMPHNTHEMLTEFRCFLRLYESESAKVKKRLKDIAPENRNNIIFTVKGEKEITGEFSAVRPMDSQQVNFFFTDEWKTLGNELTREITDLVYGYWYGGMQLTFDVLTQMNDMYSYYTFDGTEATGELKGAIEDAEKETPEKKARTRRGR